MARPIPDRDAVIAALAEAFRRHGYEGASIGVLTAATGLGKGSLYKLFPGGKDQMAAEVLASVSLWFESHVFRPLAGPDPNQGLAAMFAAVDDYFQGGQRVCLVGAFALDDVRDRFATEIRRYFADWQDALTDALTRLPMRAADAQALAQETLAVIQGALVLSRAGTDYRVFAALLEVQRARCRPGVTHSP